MASNNFFILLSLIPAVVIATTYTCNFDSGLNQPYAQNTCTASKYCSTELEYDVNGNQVKTLKTCDDVRCSTNGCYDTKKGENGYSNICCCTGDYCNSATSKSLMALPLVYISYFLLK